MAQFNASLELFNKIILINHFKLIIIHILDEHEEKFNLIFCEH